MKVIYEGYMSQRLKPVSDWPWDVQRDVKKVLELIDGKRGFRTHRDIWRDCELHVRIGHNTYTTSIEIRLLQKELIKRSNWHNGYAYFCNGVFWSNFSKEEVELI